MLLWREIRKGRKAWYKNVASSFFREACALGDAVLCSCIK